MKHKWANPTKLGAFVKKHKDAESPLLPDFIRPRDPVAVMVHSWLLWEASTEQAEQAMRKLLDAFVDYNEIRVSLPHEKATVVGKRYPRLEERLHGIRRTLHSLYLSRHTLSFDHLAEKGKRDIKSDIESLDGMHPFVAARMLRLSRRPRPSRGRPALRASLRARHHRRARRSGPALVLAGRDDQV